jgi:HEAT repeat protein
VPVPEFEHLPSEQPVVHVEQPVLAGGRAPATSASRVRQAGPSQPPSPRIVEVLALESPTVADLAEFLADPDPGVRRTAVSTLVENLPDGYAGALLDALGDRDGEVRRTAAESVRELVEVLPTPNTVAEQLDSPDPTVRAVAVYLLSARRVGEQQQYRRASADADHRVRIEAVRALVSVDDTAGVAAAAADDNREVRIAAANGLATLRAGVDAVRRLVCDRDPLVRAAALAALGAVGCGDDDLAEVQRALAEPAWQVREGAARALAGAAPTVAVPTLRTALTDAHLDVRKAAVLTLTRWADDEPAAREALGLALQDGDADVRAYARKALAVQLS